MEERGSLGLLGLSSSAMARTGISDAPLLGMDGHFRAAVPSSMAAVSATSRDGMGVNDVRRHVIMRVGASFMVEEGAAFEADSRTHLVPLLATAELPNPRTRSASIYGRLPILNTTIAPLVSYQE